MTRAPIIQGVDGADAEQLWAERFWTRAYRPDVPATIDDELALWRSVGQLFEHDAARFAQRTGFVSMGSGVDYGRALKDARAFAAWLQAAGVRQGERVALMMPNCLQYPIALFGTLIAGAVVVNVNPLYTPRELRHQLEDSGAVAIVVMDMFAHTLEQAIEGTALRQVVVTSMGDMMGLAKGTAINVLMGHVEKLVPKWRLPGALRWPAMMRRARRLKLSPVEVRPEDLAFLQYTGGTTGLAKGAMLTHRNILANVLQGRAWIMTQIPPDQAVGNVTMLPLYHVFSLTANLLMFVGVGGRNILIANPRDAKRVEWVLRKERFAGLAGLNTLFASLLKNDAFRGRDFSELSLTIAGGMATQRAVAEEWELVTGCPVIEGYGLTECSPIVCVGYVDLERPETMAFDGTVGLPVPSTEVRMRREDGSWCGVDEPGELCVRGPQVMKGYWNHPGETARVLSADGWLSTGDVAVMQADGRVRLLDRLKEMILVSGFNVYPSEIEDVVAAHPLVDEVAAVGVPDPVQGERIKVVVVARSAELTAEAVIAWCRERLTGYKVPRIVEFRVEPLPKTAVGKVLRRELR
ncbi:long-chain fatty acid--CoA ligase [Caulobacter sp. D4A]|uniref:AMP-binding protein n=1 Tax=Caulobacter sp. D4A TaxID=2204171 RepID=UPI000D739B6E|nr:AMP-binding protein [Caulobacter sp. D4A]PXA84027.1 long-chain fatty acid--CoA ligase [Caulobacter sp. D4A]